MQSTNKVHWSVWVGRGLSALVVLGLGMSASMKFMHGPDIVKGFVEHLGFQEGSLTAIGVTEVLCAILFAVPQTRLLGAALVTAYLGGATASHVRLGEDFSSPIILGVVAWVGLYLRDTRVRPLFPLVAKASSYRLSGN